MINIKDIEERYKKWPEPKEVGEARKMITKSFENLKFIEESHQYFVGDREYPPVSSVCHRFEPYTDWDKIAENKAAKLGVTKEALQEEWHQNNITSTSCGSKTHWFGEQMMNLFIGYPINLPFQYTDGYMIPYVGKEKAIEKYWTDILGNPNVFPVIPEAKLYHEELGYAGTFDILLAYRMGNGEIAFSIHDYKGLPLNTRIKTEGGWETIGTVEVGDKVYDKDGSLVSILGISEVHNNPCFKIYFDDGSFVIADHEHRWLVMKEVKANFFIMETEYEVMTTEQIANWKKRGSLYIEQKNPQRFLKIVRVEETETVPTKCIEVDSPSHTFCVEDRMLVTHNTNKDLKNSYNRSKSNTLLPPFQDYINEPLSLYGIQLSLYQLGLEQIPGIKVVDRNLIWLKEDGTYEKIGTPDLTQRLLNSL